MYFTVRSFTDILAMVTKARGRSYIYQLLFAQKMANQIQILDTRLQDNMSLFQVSTLHISSLYRKRSHCVIQIRSLISLQDLAAVNHLSINRMEGHLSHFEANTAIIDLAASKLSHLTEALDSSRQGTEDCWVKDIQRQEHVSLPSRNPLTSCSHGIGIQIFFNEDIELRKMYRSGCGYMIHSAKVKGRFAIVKLFHGPAAKEVCLEKVSV